ncbi:MAG TPA: hypothetical protein PLY34_08325 [Ferruginibacter sp.]|nr:hypothetical protein [Ferruginibacter sp.]HPH91435.1 hypothetical protein [Ferruginibacter sp.]
MKKMFFLLALPALVFSCKKDTTNVTEGCPIQQSTVAGRYVITAIKYKASSSAAEQDTYASMDACLKDDTYELRDDSTVIVGDSTNICPGPPPPGSITLWYLSPDGKQFTLDALYDVVSFDCTNLVVTQKDYFIAGDTRTVTYSKQ